MQGFQALPALVRAYGTDTVFGMLGGTNVPWVAAGVQAQAFRFVRTRHEESAVAAASAFGRVTGQIGVATVTRGPGFSNSVNALFAASHTHMPVVLVVAESPATRSVTTQNIPQRELSGLIGAGFHHVETVEKLEQVFGEAMAAARWNGSPQVVSIGDGVIDAETEIRGAPTGLNEPQNSIDPDSVAAVVDLLAKAQRPLIVAGQGAVLTDARDQILQLADLSGAFLANSLMANRFASGHPKDLGLSGSWSAPAVREFISGADLVISFGASLNDHTTGERTMFPAARIAHCEVDIDRPCLASSPELALFGDVREAVQAMIDLWIAKGHPTPRRNSWPTRRQIKESVLDADLFNDTSRGIDVRFALDVIDRRAPHDRIVVTDSGRHLASVVSLVDAPDAASWLVTRGYGSIGLGLGSAIGAAAAADGRSVILICGDGGFMMAAQELDSVRINDLDLTIVVLNDEQYASELKYLTPHRLPSSVVRQTMPNIELLAKAYDGTAVTVRLLEELEDLDFTASGLKIFDIRIDPEVSGTGPF